MSELQSIDQVRDEIVARLAPLTAEQVPLDRALGRSLMEDVRSRDAIPPFDNTAMDGFALRSADVAEASAENPIELRVSGVVEAGADALPTVGSGHAVRIYTGAPIPPGSDCVVPWERTTRFDDETMALDHAVPASACVRPRGSDIQAESIVAKCGTRLTAGALGLLATVGRSQVRVGPRLRVAVHSSGNELIPIESELTPGKIRNSNSISLCARLEQWGADPIARPILRDTPEAVRRGLRQTLALRPHAIITTGGVSAGDLDFIRVVARELGDDVNVRKVNMKPGKPLVDGLIGGVPFFGLPGNPAACLVSFEMFVRPALAKLEGRPDGSPPQRLARLTNPFRLKKIGRLQFLRGIVEFDAQRGYLVGLPDAQGSHQMSSFARANCLVEVDVQSDSLEAGDEVTVHLLDA